MTSCDGGSCVVNAGIVSATLGGSSGCTDGDCAVNTGDCANGGSCIVNAGGCFSADCAAVLFAFCSNGGTRAVVVLGNCDARSDLVVIG